jgi:hypothetical protein
LLVVPLVGFVYNKLVKLINHVAQTIIHKIQTQLIVKYPSYLIVRINGCAGLLALSVLQCTGVNGLTGLVGSTASSACWLVGLFGSVRLLAHQPHWPQDCGLIERISHNGLDGFFGCNDIVSFVDLINLSGIISHICIIGNNGLVGFIGLLDLSQPHSLIGLSTLADC